MNFKVKLSGIEAVPWLFKLPVKEPFQVTMGGLPLTLVDTLQNELNKFKKANIKPFFLFNGLHNLREKTTNSNTFNLRTSKLNNAWESYYKGQYSAAEKYFQESHEKTFTPLLSHIHYIIQYLNQKGVEVFKAPFFAGPQLALFSEPSQKNYLNAVYGSQELLLFGIYRLITDIDYEKGSYTWVDLKSILLELGLTHDQFIDACLLCGFEYCPTFPVIINSFGKDYTFKAVCDMVKQYHNGVELIRNYLYNYPTLEKYMEQFIKAKCLINNHLVFYPNCTCEPIYKDAYSRPSYDLNQIFGPRLPNDLYFYISQGVVNPMVINNFISGYLMEPFPTIESEEYCKMLDYLKIVRTKTLALLSSNLNDELKTKPVKTTRWFEPKEFDMAIRICNTDFPLSTKLTVDIQNKIKASTKPISFGFTAKHYDSLQLPPISNISNLSSPPPQNNNNNSPNNNESNSINTDPIKDTDQGIFYTLTHALRLMGYFTAPYFGKLIENVENPRIQEATVLFIELLRSNTISSEKLHFIPKPSFEGPATKPEALLLSRVLSLIPSQLDNEAWGGPIDHDIMGFHEITRTLYKSLRNLIEITCLSHFLNHKIVLPPSEYFNFSTQLPFFLQPSASMGLVVKGLILENLSIEQLENIFPNFVNIKADLDVAFEFWDTVMKIVKTLYQDNMIGKVVYDSFISADQAWNEAKKGL
ncbi:hypothetical protein CYY_008056 [Polysphondylium violaceum]|uniref:Uncharacterized protein n=1 Tax=Polysphondylium violaceum TaxID=133409 RepID=A0A8J4PMB3_9MYCE|nr:hypothetical protein CYY_008056 [Polysphondylium violaceum]